MINYRSVFICLVCMALVLSAKTETVSSAQGETIAIGDVVVFRIPQYPENNPQRTDIGIVTDISFVEILGDTYIHAQTNPPDPTIANNLQRTYLILPEQIIHVID